MTTATEPAKPAPVAVKSPPAPVVTEPAKPTPPAPAVMPSTESVVRAPAVPTGDDCPSCKPPVPALPPAAAAVLGKTTLEPAQPTDWRRSWDESKDAKTPAVTKVDGPPRELPKPPPVNNLELPQVDTRRPDPLKEPALYSKPTLADKVPVPPPAVSASMPAPAPMPVVNQPPAVLPPMASQPPAVLPPMTSQPPAAPKAADEAELRAMASQMQAEFYKGQPIPGTTQRLPLGAQSVAAAGQTAYVPVPVVTIPDVRRMPEPPRAQVPQAPQPNQEEWVNAFTPALPRGQQQPMQQPVPMYAGNAFAVPPAPNYPNHPPMPAGPMMVPHPYAAQPYGAMTPVTYSAPAPAMLSEPSAPAGQPLVNSLKTALAPSQREWAADKLALLDWKTNPQAVEALLKAAREDPAGTVRAACVRSLGRMNVNTMPVVEALKAMKADADPMVQHEVAQALAALTGGRP